MDQWAYRRCLSQTHVCVSVIVCTWETCLSIAQSSATNVVVPNSRLNIWWSALICIIDMIFSQPTTAPSTINSNGIIRSLFKLTQSQLKPPPWYTRIQPTIDMVASGRVVECCDHTSKPRQCMLGDLYGNVRRLLRTLKNDEVYCRCRATLCNCSLDLEEWSYLVSIPPFNMNIPKPYCP